MTQNGKVSRFLPRLFWVGSLLPQQRTNSGRISLAFSLFVANPRMGSRFRLSAALPFAWESSLGGLGLQHECALGGRNFLPRLRPPTFSLCPWSIMHQLSPDALLGAIDCRHELGCLRNERRPCLGERSLGNVGVVVRLGDVGGGCPPRKFDSDAWRGAPAPGGISPRQNRCPDTCRAFRGRNGVATAARRPKTAAGFLVPLLLFRGRRRG